MTPQDAAIIDENNDRVAPEYEILNDRLDKGDIGMDIGYRTSTLLSNSVTKFKITGKMTDSEYYDLMESLNEKQRKYLLHVLYCVKNDIDLPFYNMILGSAGVGKSRLIHAIYQTLLRFYFEEKDYDPESIYILKVCFTARAALNIFGLTIHKAFSINPDQCGKLNNLNPAQQNALYAKLHKLKFILIDEISMLSNKLFSYIDERLRQLFNPSKMFGGISIIAFGDFNQLPPVTDGPIYRNFYPRNPMHIY